MVPDHLASIKTQDLFLELIRRAEHNSLDGPRVAKDLDENRDLWQSCAIMMGQLSVKRAGQIAEEVRSGHIRDSSFVGGFCNMIPLRDLSQDFTTLHSDELWILSSAEDDKKLLSLVKKWDADEVDWIDSYNGAMMLGGGMSNPPDEEFPEGRSRLLRVWWD